MSRIRYSDFFVIPLFIGGILCINYLDDDAKLKLTETEKQLDENIVSSICNATAYGTCGIRYKRDPLYKICLNNTCIEPCLNMDGSPINFEHYGWVYTFDCFYIKGDLDNTLTINKQDICYEYKYKPNNRNREIKFDKILKDNIYCQRKHETYKTFAILRGMLLVGTFGLLILTFGFLGY